MVVVTLSCTEARQADPELCENSLEHGALLAEDRAGLCLRKFPRLYRLISSCKQVVLDACLLLNLCSMASPSTDSRCGR